MVIVIDFFLFSSAFRIFLSLLLAGKFDFIPFSLIKVEISLIWLPCQRFSDFLFGNQSLVRVHYLFMVWLSSIAKQREMEKKKRRKSHTKLPQCMEKEKRTKIKSIVIYMLCEFVIVIASTYQSHLSFYFICYGWDQIASLPIAGFLLFLAIAFLVVVLFHCMNHTDQDEIFLVHLFCAFFFRTWP